MNKTDPIVMKTSLEEGFFGSDFKCQRFCDTSNVLSWLMYDTSMEKYRKMSLNLFESLGGRLHEHSE